MPYLFKGYEIFFLKNKGIWDTGTPIISQKDIAFLSLKIVFILANRLDLDEMLHNAAFHLDLHCLPKMHNLAFHLGLHCLPSMHNAAFQLGLH